MTLIWREGEIDMTREALLDSVRRARDQLADPDLLEIEGHGRGAIAAASLAIHAKRLGIVVAKVTLVDPDWSQSDPISGRLIDPTTLPSAVVTSTRQRDRADLCPGVLRPWIADDGALIRLRIPGGELKTSTLARLVGISRRHADGDLHLTKRANLQLRGVAHADGCVSTELVDELTDAGVLPSASHELVRNILVSPLTGRSGGRADLRPVTRALDAGLLAEPELAALPGRFLFVLDDGRGDVAHRELDLGAFVVDAESAQVRIGSHGWGPIVPLEEVAATLVLLAQRFLAVRGGGTSAAWHVDELADGTQLTAARARDLRTHITSLPLRHDEWHVAVPGGVLRPAQAHSIIDRAGESVIVTPWRSVVLP